MTPQQQAAQQFDQAMYAERDKHIISWNNDIREWYVTAIKALNYAPISLLQIPMGKYSALFEQEPQGLNMNVVAILCNNMEYRTPAEMGMTALEWAAELELNLTVSTIWNEKNAEIAKAVMKRLEILAGKPALTVVN